MLFQSPSHRLEDMRVQRGSMAGETEMTRLHRTAPSPSRAISVLAKALHDTGSALHKAAHRVRHDADRIGSYSARQRSNPS